MNNLFIIWNESDRFGIPIIDEQHRALVSTINSLHYLLQTKHSQEALPAIINTIREYMKIHSLTEEGLMKRAGYPNILPHKELHAKLYARSLVASYKSMILNDPLEVLDFLKKWWLIHIREEDKEYVPYVIKYTHSLKQSRHRTSLFIIWNDSDCFNIPIIDEQHRALVSTINSLHYMVQTKHSQETLPAIINTIREYMKIHSLTEEGIMECANYPNLLNHKELHAKLFTESLVASYKSMVLNAPLEILDFLKKWWLIHIREEDKEYVPYVIKYMDSLMLPVFRTVT